MAPGMKEVTNQFDPDQFSEGGFFDDKDATIVKSQVVEFDYAGQQAAICALGVTFHPDDAETDDDDRTEYYKIGELSKFTPSPDRKSYVAVGSTSAMNKNAKAALFLRALKEKGFDMTVLAKGIDQLEGLHVHVNIVPMPDLKLKDGSEKKDLKILIVTKIHDAPAAGQKAGKKAGGTAKAATAKTESTAAASTSVAAGSSVEGAEDTAIGIILGLLAEKGGKLNKTLIPAVLFKQIPGDAKIRNAAVQLAGNAAWLGGADRPWKLTGSELSTE